MPPLSTGGVRQGRIGGRLSLRLVASAVCVLLASAGAAGAKPRATLTLSRASGAAGIRVIVSGRDCLKPRGQADTLAWHDHYYWLHDREKQPPVGVWRSIPVQRLSATAVRAVFVVRKSDHLGRGLLDLFCAGKGNATATFVVTR